MFNSAKIVVNRRRCEMIRWIGWAVVFSGVSLALWWVFNLIGWEAEGLASLFGGGYEFGRFACRRGIVK